MLPDTSVGMNRAERPGSTEGAIALPVSVKMSPGGSSVSAVVTVRSSEAVSALVATIVSANGVVVADSSNTVPSPAMPPPRVVPYRLPAASAVRPPAGAAPLAPVKVFSVIGAVAPRTSSNTVPVSLAPPADVVPNRLPAASATSAPDGFAPSLPPRNDASATTDAAPLTNSNIVPSPWMPPVMVVPNRSPAASAIRLLDGFMPSAPANVASVATEAAPLAISKIVPSLAVPPPYVTPYRFPAASAVRPALGSAPLGPLKVASMVALAASLSSSNIAPDPPPALVCVVP